MTIKLSDSSSFTSIIKTKIILQTLLKLINYLNLIQDTTGDILKLNISKRSRPGQIKNFNTKLMLP